jgi:hypothetical protein
MRQRLRANPSTVAVEPAVGPSTYFYFVRSYEGGFAHGKRDSRLLSCSVVIAIIGVLVALLCPRFRPPARRRGGWCSNHLKQLARLQLSRRIPGPALKARYADIEDQPQNQNWGRAGTSAMSFAEQKPCRTDRANFNQPGDVDG